MVSESPGTPGLRMHSPRTLRRDGHPRPARRIELPNQRRILKLVHLGLDAAGTAGVGVIDLTPDEVAEPVPHVPRSDQELAIVLVGRRPGEFVEDRRHVVAQIRIAAQDPQVLVDPRGSGVVVPGPGMHIATDPVRLLTQNQGQLDVGLEVLDTVGHVHAFLLEQTTPLDVGGLVETRRDLDQDRNLLAAPRGLEQRRDDRRIARCPVDGQLDGQNRVVDRGGFDESKHRAVEALVGMVDQDVAAADLPEDRARVVRRERAQPRVGDRRVSRVAKIVTSGNIELEQIGDPEEFLGRGRPPRGGSRADREATRASSSAFGRRPGVSPRRQTASP